MFSSNIKILVVDDMEAMRKVIIKILKELGFTDIIEADDGSKAWETISSSKTPIGLVISDWNMPVCMGIDLLKRVRADSRFKKTPFIMVTAESEQGQIVQAVRAGVDQYIVKPFTPDVLKDKISSTHKKYAK